MVLEEVVSQNMVTLTLGSDIDSRQWHTLQSKKKYKNFFLKFLIKKNNLKKRIKKKIKRQLHI